MFFNLRSSVTYCFIFQPKIIENIIVQEIAMYNRNFCLPNSYLHNFGHKTYHKWQGNVFDKIITRRYSKYSQVFVRKRPLKVLPAFEAK